MKDINGKIQYRDREYSLIFNLNVMEKIQEEFGSVDAWGKLCDRDEEPDIKALIFGFREMINEGIDIQNEEEGTAIPFLTRKQVGRIITEVGLENVTETINDTVIASVQSTEKNE